MAQQLPLRKDVDVSLTWNVHDIYANDELMLEDLDRFAAKVDEMVEKYQNNLNTPENIAACIDDLQEVVKIIILVGNYADLQVQVDFTDTSLRKLNAKVNMTISESMSKISFIDVEILQQPEEVIQQAIDLATDSKNYLKDLLKKKPHTLCQESEKVLSALSPTIRLPYEIYETTKLSDMTFPSFEIDGKTYPMGYSIFEDDYQYEADTAVRRKAFDVFSGKIKEYENTTAAAYNGYVQNDKIMSKLRGYDNVFDYLLADQKVTREMYDRQIDLITTKLAPHMRKYAKLIQRSYKLDEMTFADLKLPLDPDYSPKVTLQQARKYLEEGLSILGEDYVAMVDEALDNRWVDFAQNVGKSTGGFCASPYGTHSYILMTWNGRMSDVFTLAHELGHAGHFKACNAAQSVFDTNVSTYFVESPSTMNELLMSHHMLKTSDDPRFRRWIISCMVGNTYYHNFVTHLLEGAYQREVYKIVDAGGSVDAHTLSAIKRKVLEDFWGDAVTINEGAQLTWMRQPHYYMGLYSYTYSAGLTIATEVCKRIETEGQSAVDDWKNVLKAGSTLDPVGLAKLAKIDITTDEPLLDTIEYIGSLIDELVELTDQIEK